MDKMAKEPKVNIAAQDPEHEAAHYLDSLNTLINSPSSGQLTGGLSLRSQKWQTWIKKSWTDFGHENDQKRVKKGVQKQL
jgi:hypothetical protein